MSMAMQRMYGHMTPVRGVEAPNRRGIETERTRKPDLAVREKLQVLRDFGVVDTRNEEEVEREMRRLIEDCNDSHFDRVLDGYARKLISKKLGG